MQKLSISIVQTIIAAAAVGLAGCSVQSSAPVPSRPQSVGASGTTQSIHVAEPYSDESRIRLVPGMSIGLDTFSEGDTQIGGQGQKIDQLLGCHLHMTETFHIHTHLSIFDPTGTQIMVPWAVGIVAPWTYNHAGNQVLGGTCFYNLHTHDRSGIIHDESKTDLGMTLGNFFDVWGQPLTSTNVAGYNGTVWVRIISPTTSIPWTTSIDPRSILLTEHEQISLAVGNPVVPVPKYTFTY